MSGCKEIIAWITLSGNISIEMGRADYKEPARNGRFAKTEKHSPIVGIIRLNWQQLITNISPIVGQ